MEILVFSDTAPILHPPRALCPPGTAGHTAAGSTARSTSARAKNGDFIPTPHDVNATVPQALNPLLFNPGFSAASTDLHHPYGTKLAQPDPYRRGWRMGGKIRLMFSSTAAEPKKGSAAASAPSPCPRTRYRLRWLPRAWRHLPTRPDCGRVWVRSLAGSAGGLLNRCAPESETFTSHYRYVNRGQFCRFAC